MHLTRRATSCVAATAIGLTTLSGAGTAMAAPARPQAQARPQGCPWNLSYEFSKKHVYFVTNKSKETQTNGPRGVTLSLSITKGTTVHGHVAASGKYDLPKLLKAADLNISVDISLTKTMSVTKGASWKVTYEWGWLAWGASGYEFNWKLVRTDAACTVEVIGHGTAKLPADHPGFDKGRGIAPPETK